MFLDARDRLLPAVSFKLTKRFTNEGLSAEKENRILP
jgi:hypothetical protein